jgi:hypothetical protein
VRAAAPALAALGLTLALAGCQSTAERSAKLEREARLHPVAAARGLSISHVSSRVKVIGTSVLRSAEGAVAIVELRNTSVRALRSVPIAVTVTDASGRTLYQNNGAGLEATLVSVPSLPPHQTFTWIDDQVPPSGNPAAVSARVGKASAIGGSVPLMVVAGVHLIEDPTNGVGAAGTVSNRSGVAQSRLVMFGVARRGGRIVAAGRAVLPEVPAGSELPFQIFFVGDPHGAQLQVSAPATTAG